MDVPQQRRRQLALLLLLVLIVAGILIRAPLLSQPEPDPDTEAPGDFQFVKPTQNSSESIWPFTSKGRRFETRTLPINFVVRTDAETSFYLLTHQTRDDWENQTTVNESANDSSVETEQQTPQGTTVQPNQTTSTPTPSNVSNATETPDAPDPVLIVNGTSVEWGRAHGGTRYTFFRSDSGTGRWAKPKYQLRTGDYFGSQDHVRLYEGRGDESNWTAIQIHREHWDWFGLRHSVGSLSGPQQKLEDEFFGEPYVTKVSRKRYTGGGALDYGGWATVVSVEDQIIVPPMELFPLVGLVVGSIAPTTWSGWVTRFVERYRSESPVDRHYVALFLAVAIVPVAVRYGAITVERHFPTADPVVVGTPFYLLLILGLPILTGVLSLRLPPADAFIVASVAFGAGVLADYSYVNVTVLQYGVILHRIAALVALGLLAGGAARASQRSQWDGLTLGVISWILVVLGPPLGLG